MQMTGLWESEPKQMGDRHSPGCFVSPQCIGTLPFHLFACSERETKHKWGGGER